MMYDDGRTGRKCDEAAEDSVETGHWLLVWRLVPKRGQAPNVRVMGPVGHWFYRIQKVDGAT